MFRAVDFQAEASPPHWRPPEDEALGALANQVRGRRHPVDAPTAPPLRLPNDPRDMGPLMHAADRAAAQDPDRLAQIADALIRPRAVLPASNGPDDGPSFALVKASVYPADAERAHLVVVRIRQGRARKKQSGEVEAATVELVDLADEVRLREELRTVYFETDAPHLFVGRKGRSQPPTAYWLGAPRSGLPDGWTNELAALAAVDGYGLRIEALPGADVVRTAQAVNDARPELVLLWRPWLPSRKVEDRMRKASASAEIVEIDAQHFEGARDEADVVFQSVPASFRPQGAKNSGMEFQTVREAVERAQALSQHLVFVNEALRSADASPFVRPQDLYEALVALDRVAASYARDELGAGFEAAFAKAGLTGFASDISETAKNRYTSDYNVRYGDRYVLVGPHLKFGHGPPHSCARIYWYVDQDQRLLVVGHVGRHLRDATSGL